MVIQVLAFEYAWQNKNLCAVDAEIAKHLSIFLAQGLLSGGFFPGNQFAFHPFQKAVKHQPQQRQHQHAHHEFRGQHQVAVVKNHGADPFLGGDHFRRHQKQQ